MEQVVKTFKSKREIHEDNVKSIIEDIQSLKDVESIIVVVTYKDKGDFDSFYSGSKYIELLGLLEIAKQDILDQLRV